MGVHQFGWSLSEIGDKLNHPGLEAAMVSLRESRGVHRRIEQYEKDVQQSWNMYATLRHRRTLRDYPTMKLEVVKKRSPSRKPSADVVKKMFGHDVWQRARVETRALHVALEGGPDVTWEPDVPFIWCPPRSVWVSPDAEGLPSEGDLFAAAAMLADERKRWYKLKEMEAAEVKSMLDGLWPHVPGEGFDPIRTTDGWVITGKKMLFSADALKSILSPEQYESAVEVSVTTPRRATSVDWSPSFIPDETASAPRRIGKYGLLVAPEGDLEPFDGDDEDESVPSRMTLSRRMAW